MISSGKSPSPSVVLPHFIFGALSFLVVSILLLFSTETFSGHYFHPKLLAITHLTALGWGTMIVFGSLYQLLPVLLETKLHSELLAKTTFTIFVFGIILVTWSFWNFEIGIPLQIGSIFLVSALFLFGINIFATARKSTQRAAETDFISTATLWLLSAGILGLMMAINLTHPFLPKSHLVFLKVHAHLGIVGWFILLIMGIASKLIPMFLLSQSLNKKKLVIAYYLVNAGLIGFAFDFFYFEGSAFLPFYALLILGGVLSFLTFIREAYIKRMRKILDIGLKHTAVAFIVLFLPIGIGILLSFLRPVENPFVLKIILIYGVSIFLGFISTLILGQTFKTLPFIVWLDKFSKENKSSNKILPKDLYSEKIAIAQFAFYLLGLTLLIIGIFLNEVFVINSGALFIFITSLLYTVNVFKMIFITPKFNNN